MIFKALNHGDTVDIISPATACDQNEILEIKNFIKRIGLIPRIFLEKELTLKKEVTHEFPSFDAETRFKQLEDAIQNSESRIIWCTRGGYGSADLLPFLQKMKKPKDQKIFIGFSDLVSITTFLQQKWNWQIICAPMLLQIALNKVSKKSEKAVIDLLFGKVKESKYEVTELTSPQYFLNKKESEEINSIITGGCISVLSSHFGTKNQIDWQDKILFLEDEGEDGERLERYFNQIIAIITEQKKYPKAILLGNFLEANPHGTPKAKNIKLSIEIFIKKISQTNLKIPIFKETLGILGHSKNMLPLILGLNTQIKNQKYFIQKI